MKKGEKEEGRRNGKMRGLADVEVDEEGEDEGELGGQDEDIGDRAAFEYGE